MIYSCKFDYRFDNSILNALVDQMNQHAMAEKLIDSYCIIVLSFDTTVYFFTHYHRIEAHFLSCLNQHQLSAAPLEQKDISKIELADKEKRILVSHQVFEEIKQSGWQISFDKA